MVGWLASADLKEVAGRLLTVNGKGAYQYVTAERAISFFWRIQSDEAARLARGGPPSLGRGFSSAEEAALAASHHPCY